MQTKNCKVTLTANIDTQMITQEQFNEMLAEAFRSGAFRVGVRTEIHNGYRLELIVTVDVTTEDETLCEDTSSSETDHIDR